eukprot:SAG11_NODE_11340_length_767_cov_1.368263_1_plen_151_part_00
MPVTVRRFADGAPTTCAGRASHVATPFVFDVADAEHAHDVTTTGLAHAQPSVATAVTKGPADTESTLRIVHSGTTDDSTIQDHTDSLAALQYTRWAGLTQMIPNCAPGRHSSLHMDGECGELRHTEVRAAPLLRSVMGTYACVEASLSMS